MLVGGNDNDRVFRFLGLVNATFRRIATCTVKGFHNLLYGCFFQDDGWEVVDGLQLSNGDRLFSPAVAVTDEALPGCRET